MKYSIKYLKQLYSYKNCENKIAIVDKKGTRKTSFPELVKYINSCAYYLKTININKEDVVAIELPLCMEHYAWRYACNFIGAVFVSINPKLPEERKSAIKELSKAKFVVNEENLNKVVIDDFKCQINESLTDKDLGYIVFTSGTTNEPKGVLHSRSVYEIYNNLEREWLYDFRNRLFKNKKSIYGALADPTFVLSVVDMMYVCFGETIHIINHDKFNNIEELKQYYIDSEINITIALPDLVMALMPLDSLKVAVVAGEINNHDFSKVNSEIINAYGSSECPLITIDKIKKETFISHVFKNAKLLVDKDNEVKYSGPGLFIKYINDETLTKEALTYNEKEKRYFYHTHDVVKKIAPNKYQIVGRKDFVVKVLGKRINLLEIENTLKNYQTIKNAVVKISDYNKDIIEAYYITEENNVVEKSKLDKFLSKYLPKYMLPSKYIWTANLPLLPNGKVNRRLLHSNDNHEKSEINMPANDTERIVYDVTKKILLNNNNSNKNFGVTTNLIEYGLNSLTCMQINSCLSEHNMFVPLTFMLFNPNVRDWTNKVLDKLEQDKLRFERIRNLSKNTELFPITDTSIFFYDYIEKHPFIMKHVKIFNLAAIIKIKNIEQDFLVKSLLQVFDIHTGIKSTIVLKEGKPYLKRRDNWKPKISIKEINKKPDYKFFKKNTKPFDIFKDDLARVTIFKHNKNFYVLFDVHHIITDGFSQQLLIDDLLKLLSNKDVKPEIANAYDISLLFQDYLQSPQYKIDFDYFEKLQNGIKMLKYPRSKSNTKPLLNHVKSFYHDYSADKIFDYCIKKHVSVPIFFISVLCKSLSDLLDEDNFEIASLYHAREKYYEQNTFACMFNAFPVVSKGLKGKSFEYVLDNLKTQINESFKHKMLFKDSRKLIDSHDVMINYLYDFEKNDEIEQELDNGITYKQIILNSKKMTQRASTPLTINITGGMKKGIIQFGAKYNSSKFSYEDMKILCDNFKKIINQVIK